jgi:aminopeptidase N
MIEHFAELLGVPYPWSRYSQVVVSDFIFGGMENTTATTMYEYILLDERAAIDVSSDDLIAHELAHQWFGDFITCRDWSEAWLNEGFATYMEHVWREKHLGRDEYDYAIKGDLEVYLSEAHGRYRRPVVCQDYDAPLDLFDRHLYEKGGLVLHGLRVELGPKLFWRGIQDYLTRHARGVVETRDLQRALESVSGKSLGKYFEQSVYKPGHPEVDVTVAWEKDVLTVTAKQDQAATDGVPNAFDVPLDLDIVDARGTRRERLRLTERSESFAIPTAPRPLHVVVDPEMRVLGDVRTKLPEDMLLHQLRNAKMARGRWLAARGLRQFDDPGAVAALTARLSDDAEFWGVRVEAASSLGDIRGKECFDALCRAITVKHPKVRRGVVEALGRFRSSAAVDALRPRALKDESYVVEAEAARALGRTKQASGFDTLLDVLDRRSWADVISVGAIDGLAALRDDRAVPHVLSRLRYGHPARTRRAAVMALPKLSTDRKGREALEDLLEDADPLLRLDVARALGELGDAKSRAALRARLDVDLDPRVRRRLRETLRDLGQHGSRGMDQVKDDVEKLRIEHAELKARVGQLEARLGVGAKTNGASKLDVSARAGGQAHSPGKSADKPARSAAEKKKAAGKGKGMPLLPRKENKGGA